MEYKLSSASIEEERKDKIEKHYKANIDILGVMLDKYSIVALKKKWFFYTLLLIHLNIFNLLIAWSPLINLLKI